MTSASLADRHQGVPAAWADDCEGGSLLRMIATSFQVHGSKAIASFSRQPPCHRRQDR
jgi:hypothetical protein